MCACTAPFPHSLSMARVSGGQSALPGAAARPGTRWASASQPRAPLRTHHQAGGAPPTCAPHSAPPSSPPSTHLQRIRKPDVVLGGRLNGEHVLCEARGQRHDAAARRGGGGAHCAAGEGWCAVYVCRSARRRGATRGEAGVRVAQHISFFFRASEMHARLGVKENTRLPLSSLSRPAHEAGAHAASTDTHNEQ